MNSERTRIGHPPIGIQLKFIEGANDFSKLHLELILQMLCTIGVSQRAKQLQDR